MCCIQSTVYSGNNEHTQEHFTAIPSHYPAPPATTPTATTWMGGWAGGHEWVVVGVSGCCVSGFVSGCVGCCVDYPGGPSTNTTPTPTITI